MSTFEFVWDSCCGVAESPVWDADGRRRLFCDINGKKINGLALDSGDCLFRRPAPAKGAPVALFAD